MMEAERHDAIAEDDRLFLTAMAVDLIDHSRDFALGHKLVHDVERHAVMLGQHLAELNAARGGLINLRNLVAGLVDSDIAALDLGVQRNRAGIQRVFEFAHVAEHHALAGLALAHQREIVQPEHDIL